MPRRLRQQSRGVDPHTGGGGHVQRYSYRNGRVCRSRRGYWDLQRSNRTVTPGALISEQNEVQSINLAGATTGTWSINFEDEGTTSLAWDAGPVAVREALEALPNVGEGNVDVIENEAQVFFVTFVGELGLSPQPLVSLNVSMLDVPTSVERLQAGGPVYEPDVVTHENVLTVMRGVATVLPEVTR